jgi:hypothetical protein
VNDDSMISSNPHLASRSNSVDERDDELARFLAVCDGALREFRNHLTVLTTTTAELRGGLPPGAAGDLSEALNEAERNVQSLSSLVAQLDAAVKGAEPLISDLDDVIDRALRMAAPAMGRRVQVAVKKGRKSGVKNRGAALEALLSTLLVDLVRAAELKPGERERRADIEIHVEIGRGSLVIEIESDGARPSPASWRMLLAIELGARLDVAVSAHPEVAGYVLQFR